jgi:hypothetical protein
MLTCRRSLTSWGAAAVWAPGTLAGGGCASIAAPHPPQKRSSGWFKNPQALQAWGSAEPQAAQKRLPARFSALQRRQRMAVSMAASKRSYAVIVLLQCGVALVVGGAAGKSAKIRVIRNQAII